MRDILPTLRRWEKEGRRFALATVTKTWGSSPRPVGSSMGIREDGQVCGSVSGGCIETAVIDSALRSFASAQPELLHFGQISDSDAWEVGISCGGEIEVWVDPEASLRNPNEWAEHCRLVEAGEPSVLCTCFDSVEQLHWTLASTDNSSVAESAVAAHRGQESRVEIVDGHKWFFSVEPRREKLVVVGGVHIAQALFQLAHGLGMETVLIDPRAAFADESRFPVQPERTINAWPGDALGQIDLDDATYVVVLTHDPKIDDTALEVLIRSGVRYIGALGSRTTQAKRRKALAENGFTEEEIARIHGPVGLDIGAKTAEEIALAILAEIVQVKRAAN